MSRIRILSISQWITISISSNYCTCCSVIFINSLRTIIGHRNIIYWINSNSYSCCSKSTMTITNKHCKTVSTVIIRFWSVSVATIRINSHRTMSRIRILSISQWITINITTSYCTCCTGILINSLRTIISHRNIIHRVNSNSYSCCSKSAMIIKYTIIETEMAVVIITWNVGKNTSIPINS